MKISFKLFFNVLIPYFLIYIIGGMASIPLMLLKTGDSSVAAFLKNLAFIPVFFISLWFFKKNFIRIYLIVLKHNRLKASWTSFFIGLVFCLFFIALAVIITYLIGGLKFKGYGSSIIPKSYIIKDFILVGIASNLMVCITEELLFRGFLINYLNLHSKYRYLPIILSSLVFALGHFNYAYLINTVTAFTGGIVLGFTYQKTKSLYLSTGIHFAYNFYNYSFTSASATKGNITYRPFIISYSPTSIANIYIIDVLILLAFIFMLLTFVRTYKSKYIFLNPNNARKLWVRN